MSMQFIKGLEQLKNNLSNFNEDIFEEIDDVEQSLNEQALNYKGEDTITLDDLMGPSYGTDVNESSVEVENRGGLRYIDIDFSGEKLEVTQAEYEIIKNAVDEIIDGELDESVIEAINTISEFGDKAIKVVFSFARKFDLEDNNQYYDLKDLMNKLCLRSLTGRDMITAVLIAANSKPHIKLAILAAGEVREKNAIIHIGNKLSDKDLFEISVDALLDIKDIKCANYLLDTIENIEDRNEEKLNFMYNRTEYFKAFGTEIIKDVLNRYNNCPPWLKSIYGNILVEFEEDIIPDLLKIIENESDNRKLESLYRLLGRLNNDVAARHIVEAYRNATNKKAVMIGIGQIKSHESISLLREVLSSDLTPNNILEEAIQAMAFIGEKEESVALIKHHLNNRDMRIKIHVAFALARLGEIEYLDRFIGYLTADDVYDRNCANRLVNKLKREHVTYICNKCLDLSQDKVIFVLNALTKRKTFNREVGPILLKLLDKSSYLVRNEIYRLIANTARTKNEILPADILYDAREKTENQKEKMVLTEMISKLPSKVVLPTYIK